MGEHVLGWNHDVAVVVPTDGSGIALRVATARSRQNPLGITSAAIYGQGTHMALYMSSHLYVYDLRSQERILDKLFVPPPQSMFIAPGGMILTGDAQRTVKVFSDTLQEVAILTGHRARLIADVVSVGDDVVISVDALLPHEPLDTASRSIRLWDPLKNRAIGVLAMPPGREAVRLLPLRSERFIPGGASDTPMLLWAHDRQEKTVLGRHNTYAYHVAWSPDGRWVASCPFTTQGAFVRVWDVELRLEVARLPRPGSVHATLVFSQDGARIFLEVVGEPETRIESWSTESWTRIADDVTDAEMIAGIGGASGVRLHQSDCFSPDGSIRACLDPVGSGPRRGYLLVDRRRHELLDIPPGASFAFSTDGQTLAIASPKTQAIRLISTS